jgi:hypothetical protein
VLSVPLRDKRDFAADKRDFAAKETIVRSVRPKKRVPEAGETAVLKHFQA